MCGNVSNDVVPLRVEGAEIPSGHSIQVKVVESLLLRACKLFRACKLLRACKLVRACKSFRIGCTQWRNTRARPTQGVSARRRPKVRRSLPRTLRYGRRGWPRSTRRSSPRSPRRPSSSSQPVPTVGPMDFRADTQWRSHSGSSYAESSGLK